MDALLVLISLSFHYAYAASQGQHHRFQKRQQVSSLSSKPTQTSTSTTHQSSEPSLPTSIQTRIPIPPSPPPTGGVQTAIPAPPDQNPDNGPIIGFSIGIVALVLLFVATGWILFLRYKQKKQRQVVSQNTVQLQQSSNSASSVIKNPIDDTQSAVSYK